MAKMRTSILPEETIIELGEKLQSPSGSNDRPPPVIDPTPPTTHIAESLSRSLDEAATLLLHQLTPSIRDFAFELADIVLKIPRWQLVLGTFLAQYESGTLQSPSLDPSWKHTEVAAASSICSICNKEFKPSRFGQKYCSQECGVQAKKAAIEAMRNRRNVEMKMRDEELKREIESV